MRLSVLIPTYNYKCYTLVADLQSQLCRSGVEYEVIVADDGSRDQVSVIANLRINELPCCRYIQRRENVGRAAIKNFLAREAKGEWLLFLDSDAEVSDSCYIDRLIEAIQHSGGAQAIIGGLYHAATMPSPDVSLRYRYEKAADRHRSAAERSVEPYLHFTPFNLCIRRDVMLDVCFDEHCRDYGYEDVLFGLMLKRKGVKVLHIDNPLLHCGLENNAVYLQKTETALRSLLLLGDRMVPYSHVGHAMQCLQHWHLGTPAGVLFRISRPLLRRNLLGHMPNLKVFSLYKLGYLCYMSRCLNRS